MFTRKALNTYINGFLSDIRQRGYEPFRVVLFGSYAYGRPNDESDVDLAVWDKKFTGCGTADIEDIVSAVSKFPRLELHTFSEEDTPEANPFAAEILKKGVMLVDRQI